MSRCNRLAHHRHNAQQDRNGAGQKETDASEVAKLGMKSNSVTGSNTNLRLCSTSCTTVTMPRHQGSYRTFQRRPEADHDCYRKDNH